MKTDPNTTLILFYVNKIKQDANNLAKQGISSKTYNKSELDCSLGMLTTILATSYKIQEDKSLYNKDTITFTWK